MEEFATSYYSPVGVRRSYWVPVGIAAILAVGTMQIVMLHNQATTVAAVAELRLIAQSQTAHAHPVSRLSAGCACSRRTYAQC